MNRVKSAETKREAYLEAASVEALATTCPTCGAESESKGTQQRLVSHREGAVKLKRSYRYCAACGRGFFPLDRQPRLRRLPPTAAPFRQWYD